MAKTNTEKPTGKNEMKKTVPKASKGKAAPEMKNMLIRKEDEKSSNEGAKDNAPTQIQENKDTQKEEVKKEKVKTKKVKMTETSVRIEDASLSTKVSIAICKFIVGKKIENAIKDLEDVTKLKKAVPMKGEYAHREGKMMSGAYPVRASKEFIILLKSLKANANNHDLENPVISVAYANKGSKVYASGGRIKKRTHVTIIAKEKKLLMEKK